MCQRHRPQGPPADARCRWCLPMASSWARARRRPTFSATATRWARGSTRRRSQRPSRRRRRSAPSTFTSTAQVPAAAGLGARPVGAHQEALACAPDPTEPKVYEYGSPSVLADTRRFCSPYITGSAVGGGQLAPSETASFTVHYNCSHGHATTSMTVLVPLSDGADERSPVMFHFMKYTGVGACQPRLSPGVGPAPLTPPPSAPIIASIGTPRHSAQAACPQRQLGRRLRHPRGRRAPRPRRPCLRPECDLQTLLRAGRTRGVRLQVRRRPLPRSARARARADPRAPVPGLRISPTARPR